MIAVKEIKKICNANPSLWEGYTDDGRQIYVRYRHGFLTICVGEPGDNSELAGAYGEGIFNEQADTKGPLDIMSYEELKKFTKHKIGWPATEKN